MITDHMIDFSVGICSGFFRTSEVSSYFPCLRYVVNYKNLYIFLSTLRFVITIIIISFAILFNIYWNRPLYCVSTSTLLTCKQRFHAFLRSETDIYSIIMSLAF